VRKGTQKKREKKKKERERNIRIEKREEKNRVREREQEKQRKKKKEKEKRVEGKTRKKREDRKKRKKKEEEKGQWSEDRKKKKEKKIEEGKEEEGAAPPATAVTSPRQQHRHIDATPGNLLLPRFVSSCSAPARICMQNVNNSCSAANGEGAGYCVVHSNQPIWFWAGLGPAR
jgi:hypothetical protein